MPTIILNFKQFVEEIETYRQIELHAARKCNKVLFHSAKWNLVVNNELLSIFYRLHLVQL